MRQETPFTLTSVQIQEIIALQSFLSAADFDVSAFMQSVADRILNITPATGAAIELLEEDEMVYRAVSGTVAGFKDLRLKAFGSLSGLSVQRNEILHSEDTSLDLRVNVEACRRIQAASMVVVPLSRRGQTVGVLKIVSKRPGAFQDHDVQTLQLLAGLLGGALGQQLEVEGRRQAEDALRYLAMHDSLTGLPNRKLFHDRLEQALARRRRSKHYLALLYMDIDHFKNINDTYGHAVGDLLLKSFSARITDVLRASDTLARLGGDEFTVIAEKLSDPRDAELIGRKIVESMSSPFELGSVTITVSSSIGIAVNDGDPVDADDFIRQADEALYEAKRAGRNTYSFAA